MIDWPFIFYLIALIVYPTNVLPLPAFGCLLTTVKYIYIYMYVCFVKFNIVVKFFISVNFK